MKIIVDMNLSPKWCDVLEQHGFSARHWINVGRRDAPDSEILGWARENDLVVFTNDLDFSAILAATSANAPSVLQVRVQALLPSDIGDVVVTALKQFENELLSGAVVTVNDTKTRVRVLPLTLRGEREDR